MKSELILRNNFDECHRVRYRALLFHVEKLHHTCCGNVDVMSVPAVAQPV
jgi:hypothetical protein